LKRVFPCLASSVSFVHFEAGHLCERYFTEEQKSTYLGTMSVRMTGLFGISYCSMNSSNDKLLRRSMLYSEAQPDSEMFAQ
jgi:hypothetical protein